MNFIQDVLELENPISEIVFLDKEQLPESAEERIGVYDIFCKSEDGSYFIVEMQKNKIDFMTIPDSMQKRLTAICNNGGNLFISGAYIGTDLFSLSPKDTQDAKFARNTLKFLWRTNYASKGGSVAVTDSFFKTFIDTIKFNTEYNKLIYSVEAPDGIEPADKKGKVILRYAENNIGAGIAYKDKYRVVIFGFPFETILSHEARNKVMKAVFAFFKTE